MILTLQDTLFSASLAVYLTARAKLKICAKVHPFKVSSRPLKWRP